MRRLDFDDGGRAGQRRPRKFIVRYDKAVCIVLVVPVGLPPVSLTIRRYSSTVIIEPKVVAILAVYRTVPLTCNHAVVK